MIRVGSPVVLYTRPDGAAEVRFDWLVVAAQFTISAYLPQGDSTLRMMATWMDER